MNPNWKTTKTPKRPPLRVPLDASEVNQLLAVLGFASTNVQSAMRDAKIARIALWSQCDKDRQDEPEVAAAFETLNVVNSHLAKLKRQHKLLAGTIAKLKTHR